MISMIRRALQLIHGVVIEGDTFNGDYSPAVAVNGDSGISLSSHQPTLNRSAKDFQVINLLTILAIGSYKEEL